MLFFNLRTISRRSEAVTPHPKMYCHPPPPSKCLEEEHNSSFFLRFPLIRQQSQKQRPGQTCVSWGLSKQFGARDSSHVPAIMWRAEARGPQTGLPKTHGLCSAPWGSHREDFILECHRKGGALIGEAGRPPGRLGGGY